MQKHIRKAEFLKHVTALDHIYSQEVQANRARAIANKWEKLREHKKRVADRERATEVKEIDRKNRLMASALGCQSAVSTHQGLASERDRQARESSLAKPLRSPQAAHQAKARLRIEEENAALRARLKNSSSDLLKHPLYRSLGALKPAPTGLAGQKKQEKARRRLGFEREDSMPQGYTYRVRHLKDPVFRDMEAFASPRSLKLETKKKRELKQQLALFVEKRKQFEAVWTRPAMASTPGVSKTLDRSLAADSTPRPEPRPDPEPLLEPLPESLPRPKLLTLPTDRTDGEEGQLKLPGESRKSLVSLRSRQTSSRYLSSRRKDTRVNTTQSALEEQRKQEFLHLSKVIFNEKEAAQRNFEFRLALKTKLPTTHFYVGIVGLALEKNILKSDTFLIPWNAIKLNNMLEFIFTDESGKSETVLFDITKRFGSLALKKLKGYELEASIRVV